jgi:hypothetical protein
VNDCIFPVLFNTDSSLKDTTISQLFSNILNISMCKLIRNRVRVMVFNATFNNFSAKLWQSVLLVEETGVLVAGKNHQPVTIQNSCDIVVSFREESVLNKTGKIQSLSQ